MGSKGDQTLETMEWAIMLCPSPLGLAAWKEPGIYTIPDDEYRALLGLSCSALKKLLFKTPWHYWNYFFNPNRPNEEVTPVQRKNRLIGTAVHSLALEGQEAYLDRFGYPDRPVDLRKKDGKEIKAAIEASGREYLSFDENIDVRGMEASIKNSFGHYFESGKPEQSITAIDTPTQLKIKGRLDWLRPDGIVLDIKTTQDDASYAGFCATSWKLKYHVQAAYYLDLLKAVDHPATSFVFLVVEKEYPYACADRPVGDFLLEQGRREYRDGVNLIKKCSDESKWPAYEDSGTPLTAPGWATKGLKLLEAA